MNILVADLREILREAEAAGAFHSITNHIRTHYESVPDLIMKNTAKDGLINHDLIIYGLWYAIKVVNEPLEDVEYILRQCEDCWSVYCHHFQIDDTVQDIDF